MQLLRDYCMIIVLTAKMAVGCAKMTVVNAKSHNNHKISKQ